MRSRTPACVPMSSAALGPGRMRLLAAPPLPAPLLLLLWLLG